ncbi:hypothetical protein SF1_13540 [Sphingobacterium faecium NBRC 15299]|uniref:hypothetical protein n=1 Tax=Sphingobacterium faecium TaxID=34087 RepID=UPI000D338C9C|nr:hypothetical protein [Sphingobacterium faecium]PTX11853.1 hypothetical protein C8N37_103430 [Sphingobacterium faecium]GEM63372.1 hypothetical protein SF1_13540 [Sphingobacterium faecium NBRC 15299]
MNNNALDFDLAKSVGEFFRLNQNQMDSIIGEILEGVSQWENLADKIGISRAEKELMSRAFKTHF